VAKSSDEIAGLAAACTTVRVGAGSGIEAKVAAAGPAGAVAWEGAPVVGALASRCGRARGRGIRICTLEAVLTAACSGTFSALFSGDLSLTFSVGFAAALAGAADSAQPLRPPAMRARTTTAPRPAK